MPKQADRNSAAQADPLGTRAGKAIASGAQTEALQLERTPLGAVLKRAEQLSSNERAEALPLEQTFGHSSW